MECLSKPNTNSSITYEFTRAKSLLLAMSLVVEKALRERRTWKFTFVLIRAKDPSLVNSKAAIKGSQIRAIVGNTFMFTPWKNRIDASTLAAIKAIRILVLCVSTWKFTVYVQRNILRLFTVSRWVALPAYFDREQTSKQRWVSITRQRIIWRKTTYINISLRTFFSLYNDYCLYTGNIASGCQAMRNFATLWEKFKTVGYFSIGSVAM